LKYLKNFSILVFCALSVLCHESLHTSVRISPVCNAHSS
jgi:hypothetical protein